MLIFVHIPKTGGTSLSSQLIERGNPRYLSDYADRNLSEEPEFVARRDENKRALVAAELVERYDLIYGHVKADKYDCLRAKTEVKMFTMLRDPVRRVVSHYYFLKDYIERDLFPEVIYKAHPDLVELNQNKIDLVSFAGMSKYRNIYATYFSGKSVDDFDFIGITERFRESVEILNLRFGLKLSVRHIHTSPLPNPDEVAKAASELRRLNESNQHFYELALKRFWRV